MSMEPTQTIQGINFFDSRDSCISKYEKLSWIHKAISWIKSFGTLFALGLNKISLSINKVETQMTHWSNPECLSKTKLVVCIHGLNNNPSEFKKIADELVKNDLTDTDLYIPSVLEKGNAKIDDMVKPILEEIEKWAQSSSSNKELILVGISNGGRIARAIETEIGKSEESLNIQNLRFISIAGACKGSKLVNLANKIGLSILMSKNISEEMPKNSSRNKRLNEEWEEGLKHGPQRKYTFIASPHDWVVTNYSSSLMKINEGEVQYAIVPGHGHCSIANTAAKAVAEIICS